MQYHTLTIAPFFLILPLLSTALELIMYRGSHCTAEQVGHRNWTAESGCHKDGGGTANAVIVNPVEEADENSYAVFFATDDCNPDKIIGWNDGLDENNCIMATYSSFEIWSMCENGDSGCLA